MGSKDFHFGLVMSDEQQEFLLQLGQEAGAEVVSQQSKGL